MQSSFANGPSPDIQFQVGCQVVRDYTFSYTKIGASLEDNIRFAFPATGYLIFNLITGNDFTCHFLNYNLSESTPNHLYITGLLSKGSLTLTQHGNGGGYAMKIHPVAGYHFLKIPMYRLTDRQVRLSAALESEGSLLRKLEANEEIHTLGNAGLNKFFCQYLPDKSVYRRDPIYHAVNKIISEKGLIKVRQLAKEFCMSERTLHRQFLLKVGLPPQAYAKIWQLQYAMNLLQNHQGKGLFNIALEAGYYDVAHLARDFRQKVAIPPSDFYTVGDPMIQSYLNFSESLK